MTRPAWLVVAEVFERALPLEGPQRARYLDERCGTDDELRREVESLLANDESAEEFLAPPPLVPGASRPRSFAPGATLGGFTLVRPIAGGGMGTVYEAVQAQPRRRVAIKVLSAILPGEDARRRFSYEAEILGRLNHPAIAHIHASGVDEGVPFLAMELVEGGLTITEYARSHALGRGAIIALFRSVCAAVAHGHAKGVIHRDLKPSNVLVDQSGAPKVIDFGIARVLGADDGDATRLTRAGDLVGTLQYMSPEQAEGRANEVDAQSDVYALGLLLYELLCGRPPYVLQGKALTAVLRTICEEPPVRPSSLRSDLEIELEWILLKALEKDRSRRYGTVSELDLDLARCVAHEPVSAGPPSTTYRMRKFVRRHRVGVGALALVFAALVAGLATSLVFKARADQRAADLQAANTTIAATTKVAQDQERIAKGKADDVLSLSAIQDLKALEDRAGALWPATPEMVPKYEDWLRDARALIEGRAGDPARGIKPKPSLAQHEAKLLEIRQRSKPLTNEQAEADRRSSPSYAEWARSRAELTWMRRMLGEEAWPAEAEIEGRLEQETLPSDANGLNALAWPLVDPDPTKIVYGSEVRALLLARRAVAAASAGQRALIRDTLGWALFRCGRLEEALAEERLAVDELAGKPNAELSRSLDRMVEETATWRGAEALAKRRAELAQLDSRIAELDRAVNDRRSYEFEESEDVWWHAQLSTLVARLKDFTDDKAGGLYSAGISEKHGWGIARRAEFGRAIGERSVDGPEARRLWSEAIAAIAASPQYGGLKLTPQLGLLPIGEDHDSHLWEFTDLQTGEPVQRETSGKLIPMENMGLVFVLIPGGSFWMGAQRTDPNGRNYDSRAASDESPVHEVTLSAYFLSKYEMTQGQWERFAGSNPSQYGPSSKFVGDHPLLHPVEQVTWTQCMSVMSRLGLALPSEAQWENGCRAGTETPWWTGKERESLRGFVNLADRAAARTGAPWPGIKDWPELEDGWPVHAPVGRFPANPYGLHEVAGNVSEWCLDGYSGATYASSPKEDPVARWSGGPSRLSRGGSFFDAASFSRSAVRLINMSDFQSSVVGLRPARAVSARGVPLRGG